MLLANAGIPLIGPVIALGWLTIVPVVIIEAFVAMRLLGWHFLYAMKWLSLANALSMLLGVPFVWFLAAVVSTLTGQMVWGDGSILGVIRSPAWFGPGYAAELRWAIPLALILLLIPCFLMSCWAEFLLLRLALPSQEQPGSLLWSFAWRSNFASYTFLVLLLLLELAAGL